MNIQFATKSRGILNQGPSKRCNLADVSSIPSRGIGVTEKNPSQAICASVRQKHCTQKLACRLGK